MRLGQAVDAEAELANDAGAFGKVVSRCWRWGPDIVEVQGQEALEGRSPRAEECTVVTSDGHRLGQRHVAGLSRFADEDPTAPSTARAFDALRLLAQNSSGIHIHQVDARVARVH